MTTDQETADRWVGYRPQIKVVDCTIRDGGLMNDHRFDDDTVRAVWQACVAAGVDYMEIGYRNSPRLLDPQQFGTWKFSSEADIRRIVGDNGSATRVSVMADVGRCDIGADFPAKDASVVDMVRVACYIHQVPAALDMVKELHDKGYETCLNLMSVSVVPEHEVEGALKLFAGSEAGTLYVVDSFGSLYGEQVRSLVARYLEHATEVGKLVGIHAHNNQQLAFANTIEALVLGANRLDCSIAGLGRGAGNCPTENLLGFLHNPRYHLRPLLDCIQDHIEPLRAHFRWGPDIPYLIAGQMNQHPRASMRFNETEPRGRYAAFYDRALEGE